MGTCVVHHHVTASQTMCKIRCRTISQTHPSICIWSADLAKVQNIAGKHCVKRSSIFLAALRREQGSAVLTKIALVWRRWRLRS